MFTFFASNALGANHPGLSDDPAFTEELLEAARNKVSNSDVYTAALAACGYVRPRHGPGRAAALLLHRGWRPAVENALKTAFDWKSRLNESQGRPRAGHPHAHLTDAFHGRTGYTMTLTNTDPTRPTGLPPGWPRITSPYWAAERDMDAGRLSQAEAAFEEHPHDIAAFIRNPSRARAATTSSGRSSSRR